MGLCASQSETKKDETVGKYLEGKHGEEKKVVKFLLLGTGESGKSTIIKQLEIIYGQEKFQNENDITTFRNEIRRNAVESMQVLLAGLVKYSMSMKNSKSDVSAKFVNDMPIHSTRFWTNEAGAHINFLWQNEPAVREVYEIRSKLQLPDSTPYYFENVQRMSKDDFVPTQQDIIRTRLRSTGIVERMFTINNVSFKFLDVGGQRNERRKWIHSFEGVASIIFVTAISEYDQLAFEDETENRLHESLRVFEETINNKFFKSSAIILFMNKIDLFAEKIKKVSLNFCFKEYNGDNTFNDATNFIKSKFLATSQDKSRPIFSHLICATDTLHNFDTIVFEACYSSIFGNNMNRIKDSTEI